MERAARPESPYPAGSIERLVPPPATVTVGSIARPIPPAEPLDGDPGAAVPLVEPVPEAAVVEPDAAPRSARLQAGAGVGLAAGTDTHSRLVLRLVAALAARSPFGVRASVGVSTAAALEDVDVVLATLDGCLGPSWRPVQVLSLTPTLGLSVRSFTRDGVRVDRGLIPLVGLETALLVPSLDRFEPALAITISRDLRKTTFQVDSSPAGMLGPWTLLVSFDLWTPRK
ncbi:MAG: hypothetical protein JXB39_12530 [Deltaproteobacteria bacterium]|nr:hypothetical protein [Deltaproteobacteria bacterium]